MPTPDDELSLLDLQSFPDFPPTDETGDVDLSLLDHNLRLTIYQRICQHGEALKLVRALQKVREQWYGADEQASEEA